MSKYQIEIRDENILASNYLVLKGTLSRDKKRLLQEIRYAIDNPEKVELREEWERGF